MRHHKWPAPALLLLLLVQWVALPLWWQLSLKRALHEWQEGPPVQMTLSRAQFEQYQLGKRELHIKGEFYDIRAIEWRNDTATILAQRDYHEEQQWAAAEHSGIHHLPDADHQHEIAAFFQVFLAPEGLPFFYSWQAAGASGIVFIPTPLMATFGEIPVPPPKLTPADLFS